MIKITEDKLYSEMFYIDRYRFQLNIPREYIIVTGDSGVGKTYVYNYFKKNADKGFKCLDIFTAQEISKRTGKSIQDVAVDFINEQRDSLVFFDNYENLYSDKLFGAFWQIDTPKIKRNNKYVFFTNYTEGIFNSTHCYELERSDISREFILKPEYP